MVAEVFEYTGGVLRGAAIIGAFRKLGAYGGAALEIRRFGILEQALARADNFAGVLVAAFRKLFLHEAVKVGAKVHIGHGRPLMIPVIG